MIVFIILVTQMEHLQGQEKTRFQQNAPIVSMLVIELWEEMLHALLYRNM